LVNDDFRIAEIEAAIRCGSSSTSGLDGGRPLSEYKFQAESEVSRRTRAGNLAEGRNPDLGAWRAESRRVEPVESFTAELQVSTSWKAEVLPQRKIKINGATPLEQVPARIAKVKGAAARNAVVSNQRSSVRWLPLKCRS
jgi:hypothetical protein